MFMINNKKPRLVCDCKPLNKKISDEVGSVSCHEQHVSTQLLLFRILMQTVVVVVDAAAAFYRSRLYMVAVRLYTGVGVLIVIVPSLELHSAPLDFTVVWEGLLLVVEKR